MKRWVNEGDIKVAFFICLAFSYRWHILYIMVSTICNEYIICSLYIIMLHTVDNTGCSTFWITFNDTNSQKTYIHKGGGNVHMWKTTETNQYLLMITYLGEWKLLLLNIPNLEKIKTDIFVKVEESPSLYKCAVSQTSICWLERKWMLPSRLFYCQIYQNITPLYLSVYYFIALLS